MLPFWTDTKHGHVKLDSLLRVAWKDEPIQGNFFLINLFLADSWWQWNLAKHVDEILEFILKGLIWTVKQVKLISYVQVWMQYKHNPSNPFEPEDLIQNSSAQIIACLENAIFWKHCLQQTLSKKGYHKEKLQQKIFIRFLTKTLNPETLF